MEHLMSYFGMTQPNHSTNHIRNGTDLRVGDAVVVHLVYNGEPKQTAATVSHLDAARQTVKFTEWGDGAYPWGDYGLAAYLPGTQFSGVDVGGMFHQKHWLERVAVN